MKLQVGKFYRWLDMLPERNHNDSIFKVMATGFHRSVLDHNAKQKKIINWGPSYTIVYPYSRWRVGGDFRVFTISETFLDKVRAGVVEWKE